jgi:DNA-3-methyladenine glycosylase
MVKARYTPLPRSFYARPVLAVARDCIGKILVHEHPEGRVSGRIVEAEAYRGPEDRAAHSYAGRRTARTEVMFGEPGYAYVFFIYGMHWNFNIVTTRVGDPHAVLVRAIEPVDGLELMAARRRMEPTRRELTNGPGKVCAALGITREHYAMDLCKPPLYLVDGPHGAIARSARVGIDYAEEWMHKPWRFYEQGNRYVSVIPRKSAQNRDAEPPKRDTRPGRR